MDRWWTRRRFVFLWVCRLLTYLGDQMLTICLTVRVFRAFGTGAALGTLYVFRLLPSAIVGPVAGVFIDRFDRRLLAAVGLGLSSVAAVGLYCSAGMSQVLAFTFLGALAAVLYGPSLKGMLPDVVEKEYLLKANSVQSGTESVARLAAPAISAGVLSIAGTSGALLASACSYLLAAGTVFQVKLRGAADEERPEAKAGGLLGGIRAAGKQLIEGVRYLVAERVLLLVTIAMTMVMFADTSVSPLFTILLNKHLKVPPEFIGFLSSGYGAGLLIGAVLGPLLAKVVGESGLVPLGALFIGGQMLAYSRIQAFWLTLPLQLVCGAGFALLLNGAVTVFQMVAPRRLIGRAVTASTAVGSMATMVAARAGGAVADAFGVKAVFLCAGLVSLCAAAFSLQLARGLRRSGG
jgi:MFS family permease